MKLAHFLIILLLLSGCAQMKIKEGSKVKVEYVGAFDNKEVFDQGEIEFTVGKHEVIKGFEDVVIGMKIGEEKEIKLPPEQAYGPSNPDLIKKLPRDKLPKDIEIKQDMFLTLSAPAGQVQAKVIAIDDKEITLDLNNPMAGKILNFKIKILEVS